MELPTTNYVVVKDGDQVRPARLDKTVHHVVYVDGQVDEPAVVDADQVLAFCGDEQEATGLTGRLNRKPVATEDGDT
ncbi:MAG: hypothetical protein WC768_04725 [Patescibacteria group bacterium]|jgi:hypothetical protein